MSSNLGRIKNIDGFTLNGHSRFTSHVHSEFSSFCPWSGLQSDAPFHGKYLISCDLCQRMRMLAVFKTEAHFNDRFLAVIQTFKDGLGRSLFRKLDTDSSGAAMFSSSSTSNIWPSPSSPRGASNWTSWQWPRLIHALFPW